MHTRIPVHECNCTLDLHPALISQSYLHSVKIILEMQLLKSARGGGALCVAAVGTYHGLSSQERPVVLSTTLQRA